MPAPRAFDSFLAQHGPLLRSELLPTPGANMRWRGLRGSRHQINRRRLPLFHHTSVIPPDDLTDEAIISDHSHLLQYHLQRFRQEIRTYVRVQRRTQTVVGKRRGGVGIDITTHSFMDTAPPRLDPSLITIVSRSIRYHERMGDCEGHSYQGVARVEDEFGGWDLDGMRWHQILKEGYA
eukprot:3284800-Rhodomonas_salina.1